MSQRYKLVVAYDGTAYCGWQIQPDAVTVQGELQRVVARISGEEAIVHCSGRTDQGVHARAQVVHFDLAAPRQPAEFRRGLNALLPADIRVADLAEAPADFHARRSAVGKEYRYCLWDGPVLPPFIRHYRAHAPRGLDVDRMRAAAAALRGRHDFASFTANPNREVGSTVRTVDAIDIERDAHELVIAVRGEGFLYKMVRSLAGFLIAVGEGRLPPEAAGVQLAARERTATVETAPPQGLFLWQVFYESGSTTSHDATC